MKGKDPKAVEAVIKDETVKEDKTVKKGKAVIKNKISIQYKEDIEIEEDKNIVINMSSSSDEDSIKIEVISLPDPTDEHSPLTDSSNQSFEEPWQSVNNYYYDLDPADFPVVSIGRQYQPYQFKSEQKREEILQNIVDKNWRKVSLADLKGMLLYLHNHRLYGVKRIYRGTEKELIKEYKRLAMLSDTMNQCLKIIKEKILQTAYELDLTELAVRNPEQYQTLVNRIIEEQAYGYAICDVLLLVSEERNKVLEAISKKKVNWLIWVQSHRLAVVLMLTVIAPQAIKGVDSIVNLNEMLKNEKLKNKLTVKELSSNPEYIELGKDLYQDGQKLPFFNDTILFNNFNISPTAPNATQLLATEKKQAIDKRKDLKKEATQADFEREELKKIKLGWSLLASPILTTLVTCINIGTIFSTRIKTYKKEHFLRNKESRDNEKEEHSIYQEKLSAIRQEYRKELSKFRQKMHHLLKERLPKKIKKGDKVLHSGAFPVFKTTAFKGREEELNNLMLGTPLTVICQHVTVGTGSGGLGKTQLALAYVENTKNYSHIIWLDANQNLSRQYFNLALEIFRLNTADMSDKQRIEVFYSRLSHRQENTLIVFDDVRNEKKIAPYLNTLIPELECTIIEHPYINVLITAREYLATALPNYPIQTIYLDKLTMPAAIALLKQNIPARGVNMPSQKSFQALATEFYSYPFPLKLAALYIKHQKISPEKYLTIWRNISKSPKLSKNLPYGSELERIIYYTIALIFKELSPPAKILLALCSHLGSDSTIPEPLASDCFTNAMVAHFGKKNASQSHFSAAMQEFL